jgi:hypothetical protein
MIAERVKRGLACPPPMVTRLSRSCSFVASTLTAESEWRLFGQVERWPLRQERVVVCNAGECCTPARVPNPARSFANA